MKKIVALALFLCSMLAAWNASAQGSLDRMYFYGADFSLSRALGVDESESQFRDAFGAINQLFISEADKYDVERYSGIRVLATDVAPVCRNIENMDFSGFFLYSTDYAEPAEGVMENVVKEYNLSQSEGTGLVFFPLLLDKRAGVMVVEMVVFDIASRDILLTEMMQERIGGFGLRNYWAKGLHNAIKDLRYIDFGSVVKL